MRIDCGKMMRFDFKGANPKEATEIAHLASRVHIVGTLYYEEIFTISKWDLLPE